MANSIRTGHERDIDHKRQLQDIVGAGNVSDEPAALEKHSHDLSFTAGSRPLMVVRPKQAQQVQEIVRWANQTLIPLVPVSSGPPHFRGDSVPSLGGVVVDLSGMDRILRIDRRNRVAMVEPGVTFGALKAEVEKQGMRVMLPLAPRTTKSVVGSYLEREPILVPKYHWDMADPLCCTEVVFGTGDLFRTGAAAGPGTLEEQWQSGQAQKSPVGPGPSDLFRVVQGAQGTLGILTWATVRLELLPSVRRLFMVGCEKVDAVIDFVYRLQRLKLGDECLILDQLNLASILAPDARTIEECRSALPPYVLIFVIAGYERLPEERVAYQTRDAEQIAQSFGLHPLATLPGVDSRQLLRALSEPSAEPYWKLRYQGNIAEIFFLTTLDRSPLFVEVMHHVARETGFPETSIGTYIQPVQQGRSCHLEFDLAFDPGDKMAVALTKKTLEQASKALMHRGAFFSRPYGIWSELISNQYAENVAALRKVKRIFDPNNVMNPGKLCF
ncbi:MAG: FAD-binding oxidoreductase [Dehalococcoidia bacterium]|nr:FAD-binding oxidoreductase [Dehalococcoidia bacterium]